jgi:hypothetical protein
MLHLKTYLMRQHNTIRARKKDTGMENKQATPPLNSFLLTLIIAALVGVS